MSSAPASLAPPKPATNAPTTALPKPADSTKRRHIYAIDYVRLGVIGSVVAIHLVSQIHTTALVGAVMMLLHINRELFITISAFVLTYSYGRRKNLNWPRFWRRRYLLAGVPYVVWTAIYVLADGQPARPWIQEFGYYLLNGRARYQLYFLLILFQLYLFFPLIRWLLTKTEPYHRWVLAVSAVAGIVFTALVQRSVGANGAIGFWLGNPDPWLLSYLFFIVVGALAAWHFDLISAAIQRYRRLWGWLALGVSLISLGVYGLQLHAGLDYSVADTTFQPIVLAQTLAVLAWLLSLGQGWEQRGAPGKRWVVSGAVATFGIYLVHPLVIQFGGWLIVATGMMPIITTAPSWVKLLAVVVIGLPMTMLASYGFSQLAHRTPLSLPLAGRPRQRPGQP